MPAEVTQSTGRELTCSPYSTHSSWLFFQYQIHCVVSRNVGLVTDDGVERRRIKEEQQVIVWKLMFLLGKL